MKKVLLGSTALVAGGLLASPAFAQLTLNITGDVDVHAGITSESNNTDRESFGFTTDTTLNFNADGVADNGLTYGVRINVDDNSFEDGGSNVPNPNGGDGFLIDETYVFFGGGWGTIRFGADDPASSTLRFTVPAVGTGLADGDQDRYINRSGGLGGAKGTDFAHSNDANKIIYIGTFGGFQVGASFTPSDNALGANPDMLRGTATGIELRNTFSLGLNYKGEFNNGSWGISGGYVNGKQTDSTNSKGDHTEYGVGAEVGVGGFLIGGFYINSQADNPGSLGGGKIVDRTRWGLGLTFATGPWSFGINGLYGKDDKTPATTDTTEDQVIGLGLEYALADGLTPYAEVTFFDYRNDANAAPTNKNDGSVIILGITAAF